MINYLRNTIYDIKLNIYSFFCSANSPSLIPLFIGVPIRRSGFYFSIRTIFCFAIFFSFTLVANAQFPSNAIHKDSRIIKEWAINCTVQRGYVNISDKKEGRVTVGKPENAIGKSQQSGVVSLGDSGVAILTFKSPIKNGKGYDFAVFENSFDGKFLELAFVEVSEDGRKYVRFNAESRTDTFNQIGTFGNLQASKISNLAGKYEAGFGTPFDLDELKDSLNVNNINFVKIVDVVGSINPKYGTKDSKNRFINDPFPTPFPSSGFDLDAVAVLKENTIGLTKNQNQILVYPNPLSKNMVLNIPNYTHFKTFELIDVFGKEVMKSTIKKEIMLNTKKGVYFLLLKGYGYTQTIKLIITE